MADLTGLVDLISDKMDSLSHSHMSLQESARYAHITEAEDTTQTRFDLKTKYISLAGDIVLLSRSIVATWIPIAKQSADRILSQRLLSNLTKVDVLAGQLRAVKNTKNYKDEDYDEGGQVLTAAMNVVNTTKDALESLEAIRITLTDGSPEANLKVELKI